MPTLIGLDTAELSALAEQCGEPAYRGRQVARWLYERGQMDLSGMTDLSKRFRQALADQGFQPGQLSIAGVQVATDATRKYLFASQAGGTLEAVLMPYWDRTAEALVDGESPLMAPEAPPAEGQPRRVTACISTQVGCAVGCVFCATGLSGFQKNITAGDMVEQVVQMQAQAGYRISNVVFMGMGEPFMNYEETLQAVRLLNREVGIGMRHLTISTSGIIPGIERLSQEGLQATLAVSLHAPNDRLRDYLVPINARYPLGDLRQAMLDYVARSGRRITIEYVMLDGVNDSAELAHELGRYLKGLHVHVNLIPYNATDAQFRPSSPAAVGTFRAVLQQYLGEVTVRVERGAEIDSACGQLRRRLQSGSPLARGEGFGG